jgi:pectate lyase
MKRTVPMAIAILALQIIGCEERRPGEAIEIARSALSSRVHAEAQTWVSSTGDDVSASSTTVRFGADAVGDFFELLSPVPAGVYDVTVRYARRNLYGDYDLSVDAISVGPLPGYAADKSDQWTTVTFTGVRVASGAAIAFTVTGRNTASTDYDLKIDYLDLVDAAGDPSGTGDVAGTGTGGATSTGGGPGKGGATGSGASSGSGGAASVGSIPMVIPAATGTEVRASATVLAAGVHDFQNRRIGVTNPVGCDGEGQPAVFELQDGATLTNVIIHGGTPGGNGVVCLGNCTLDHVYWEDVCEDAATNSRDGATMRISHIIALNASDKVFQHNAKGGSRTIITDSYMATLGKVWRSCGDCTGNGGPRFLELDNVRVDGVGAAIAGVNQNYGDKATIRHLYVKGGYDAGKDKPKICQVYLGVPKGSGSSKKLFGGASQFNSDNCDVSPTDILDW